MQAAQPAPPHPPEQPARPSALVSGQRRLKQSASRRARLSICLQVGAERSRRPAGRDAHRPGGWNTTQSEPLIAAEPTAEPHKPPESPRAPRTIRRPGRRPPPPLTPALQSAAILRLCDSAILRFCDCVIPSQTGKSQAHCAHKETLATIIFITPEVLIFSGRGDHEMNMYSCFAYAPLQPFSLSGRTAAALSR